MLDIQFLVIPPMIMSSGVSPGIMKICLLAATSSHATSPVATPESINIKFYEEMGRHVVAFLIRLCVSLDEILIIQIDYSTASGEYVRVSDDLSFHGFGFVVLAFFLVLLLLIFGILDLQSIEIRL